MKACGNDSSNKPVLLPMADLASCPAADSEFPPTPPRLDQPFVTGSVEGPSGKIPLVSSALTRRDRWGSIKARWGVGRMDYAVDPGLYALGSPDEASPVLVTANYKMSFDRLREALPGRNGWILVLDTKGINVWCAAGKGTFGTEELLRRIAAAGLKDVVKHRDLILPQLGAPGVSAHLVRKAVGLQGPLRADSRPGPSRLSRRRPQGDGRDAAEGLSAAGARRSDPHRTGRRAEARHVHHPPPADRQRFRRGRGIRPTI